MRKRRVSDNALLLSFLDVLSCGLGAAVLLFLVFSLIGEDQPLALSSPNYIMIRGELKNANTNAVLRILICPPGGPPIILCMEGNPNHCIDVLKAGEPIKIGSSQVLLSLTPESDLRSMRMFAIRVLSPTHGPWEVGFRYDINLELVHGKFDLAEGVTADAILDLELTTRDKSRGENYKLKLKMNRWTNCSDVVEQPSSKNFLFIDETKTETVMRPKPIFKFSIE